VVEFLVNVKSNWNLKVKSLSEYNIKTPEVNKIIDVHAHIFPDKVAEKAVENIGSYYGIPMYGKGTVSDLFESGGKIGVYRYIVHSTATKPEQVKHINNYIASAQASNSCITGFGTLHPELKNTEIKTEVERLQSLGISGIKLHPDFQGFDIDQENMIPIYSAIEGKLPLLIHMGDKNKTSSSPKRLARILKMFPGLTVIAAHMGGYTMWDESMEYLVGKNVYFDTSSTLMFLDKSRAVEMIRAHGAGKVLFGTDYPMWSHQDELQRLHDLGLSADELELIFWKNASGILGINLSA